MSGTSLFDFFAPDGLPCVLTDTRSIADLSSKAKVEKRQSLGYVLADFYTPGGLPLSAETSPPPAADLHGETKTETRLCYFTYILKNPNENFKGKENHNSPQEYVEHILSCGKEPLSNWSGMVIFNSDAASNQAKLKDFRYNDEDIVFTFKAEIETDKIKGAVPLYEGGFYVNPADLKFIAVHRKLYRECDEAQQSAKSAEKTFKRW